MVALQWDKVGERTYETGVSNGVLYIPDSGGDYDTGYAWNGLTTVTETPSGAENTPQYADNIKYLNLRSAEEFGATIEAFTYPDEFAQCDGTAEPITGVYFGQQSRKPFGFSWQTKKGNDLQGVDYGYKIHLVYGAEAAPSEKTNTTMNDSPEAVTFSWELTTTAMSVGTVGGVAYKPVAHVVVDSTKVDAGDLADLEEILYGTAGTDPRLPTPAEVYAMFAASVTEVTPGVPTYNSSTDIITIPNTTGVVYEVNDVVVPAGSYGPITSNTVVTARPAAGYKFPNVVDDDWMFTFA